MSQMTTVEEEIFYEALEIADAAQREDYLRRACPSDTLRQAVDGMLALHERGTQLFQRAVTGYTLDGSSSAEGQDADADIALGSHIGPYRLIQKLGEGGGGVVYEAQQEKPVHRRVALKILKRSASNRRALDRFRAEREALELMAHPNIAMVLDAGETADGRPYFVIELVGGVKITDYCAQQAAPLTTRLGLMQQVCSAIQHAHQKGIIHCDLKPSNILVTLVEGVPIPKVIDFGIAKATVGVGDAETRQAHPVGTPAYMSPEQIDGSKDIDTRSDIYSLGIILYELLAGCPPIVLKESTTTGFSDLRDGLHQGIPMPPSRVARQSGTAACKWNQDLDCIVMKALEKDRESRYATVRSLSEDIARYLGCEPVSAHPPSRLYRLRKFVRRNRLASAAILGLAVGFTSTSIMYFRAEAAEQKQAQLRAEAEEREYVTKAAILLMQDKPAEADAEIQKMAGMLTQPSVEATNVFMKLAIWNALRGDLKAASQRLLALSRVNRFDDTDTTEQATRDFLALPPTLIETGNVEALAQFEEMLLDRLGHTKNPVAAEEILKMCLLAPPSQEILQRLGPVAAVAENSLSSDGTKQPTWLEAWRYFSLGLWYYRIGDYQHAIELVNLAIEARQTKPVANACCLMVRSMALRQLGQTGEADSDIATVESTIVKKCTLPMKYDDGGTWQDWLTARILLRETQQR
jgi:serine/threonine protein kinase